ncbi:hypothetical protein C4J81_15580 [Deltaproteobacteria bacterium Smac51]|nr:hypothetical protein C4J81_15580 [Deltaproteobacteria bacterium Smac51]
MTSVVRARALGKEKIVMHLSAMVFPLQNNGHRHDKNQPSGACVKIWELYIQLVIILLINKLKHLTPIYG